MARVAIAKDILDRAGYRPPEKHEHEIAWDGDTSKLSDEALERLAFYLERIAFGDDKARALEVKRRAYLEAGVSPDVIEAEFQEGDSRTEAAGNGAEEPAASEDNGAGSARAADDENW